MRFISLMSDFKKLCINGPWEMGPSDVQQVLAWAGAIPNMSTAWENNSLEAALKVLGVDGLSICLSIYVT